MESVLDKDHMENLRLNRQDWRCQGKLRHSRRYLICRYMYTTEIMGASERQNRRGNMSRAMFEADLLYPV